MSATQVVEPPTAATGRTPLRPWLPWLALGLVLGALAPGAAGRALGIGGAPTAWWWMLGLPLAVSALTLPASWPWAGRWLLFASACLLGGALGSAAPRPQPTDTERLVAVRGTVVSVKWNGHGQGLLLDVDAVELPTTWQPPHRLFVRADGVPWVAPGDQLIARGLWRRSERGDEVQATETERVALREDGPRGWAWRALERVGPHHELAQTLLLGRGDAPEKPAFRASGLLHLLAVSGSHLAIAAALGAWLLRVSGVAWWPRQLALAGLIAGYAWLTSASPATLRALAMALAVIAAGMLAREPHRLAAVSLAALVLLLIDPGNAGDIGFQLSLAAVLGIVTLGLDLVRLRRQWLPLAPWPLDRPSWRGLLWTAGAGCDGLAIGVAASLATAPLLAWHFGTANPWGAAVTLVATPPTAFALWLGLPLMTLDGLWPGGPWAGLYAGLDASLAALAATAEWAARLPAATVASGAPSPLMMCAWPLLFLPLGDHRDLALRVLAVGGLLLCW